MHRDSAPGVPSIDCLQVLIQCRLIMASKCIYKLARSWPPRVSPESLHYGLQVRTIMASTMHLQSRAITASKCISKFAWSRPPCVCPRSLHCGLHVCTIMVSKCISKLAWWQSRSESPSSPYRGLQVYLQISPIAASICIPILTRSRPWSVHLSSLDSYFQAHLEFLSSTACSRSRYTVCRWVAI